MQATGTLSRTRPSIARSTPPLKLLLLLRNSSSSSSSSSFASRSYPGLYFHPTTSPSSYSISFLPTRAPSLSFSPTTIGQLSTPTPSPSDQEEEPLILPRYFKENSQFLDLVHEVLKREIERGQDLYLTSLAKSITSSQNGGIDTFIHLSDQRNPPEQQRTPQPQDILCSFLVRGESGEIVKESYERNKVAYRLVSELGLMKLPPSLFEKLVEACKNVRDLEQEVAKEQQQ